jgi:AP2-associated kinase
MAVYASNMSSRGPFANSTPPVAPSHAAPPGTFLPGTKVQVGTHRVVIDRYLSEGGFAHVYVVTLPRPVDGNQKAVLKRVAVPDKEHLANMRTEVETMKRLRQIHRLPC